MNLSDYFFFSESKNFQFYFKIWIAFGLSTYTVKIVSDKLRHITGTFGGFDTLLLQAK